MSFKSTSGLIALATLFAATSMSAAMPITLDFPRELGDFEGVDLEARQGALSCYPVDVDQIKSLPAWKKIEQYAKDTWGEGGVNIVTNPSEYPDRALQACMKTSKVNTQFTEKPQCTTDRKNIAGQSVGTKSDIEFTTKRGTSQTTSWTVTRSSTLTAGVKFGISVGIPGIGDATAETSISTEIKNERSSSFSGTVNNEDSITMKYSNEAGKQCKVELVTQTCSAKASGRVPVVVEGFVWFNYEDKRAPKNSPQDGEHYKYSANINSILSEADRTTYIEFQGPVNSKSASTYKTNCVDIGKGKKAAPKKKAPAPKKGAAKPAPKKKGTVKPAPKKAAAKPAPAPAKKPVAAKPAAPVKKAGSKRR